ncbi:AraC family transcriptional regulator [Vibrio sp. SCSIO 43136]|uniref:AraC family transcriptional regulator n=1 Tax=Vibrio sp. SCSIO 43136 TaxID=2819101 RepID=UPI002074D6D5|nr:AraC family transcriptional regulator [Vibrio sp. SCSIO 43136]USD67460.1 helix-turn-helix domain-containing protein [Vibrio sp. SCSIO 43136]
MQPVSTPSAMIPAEIQTLSSEMNIHSHDYVQIVIGLSGKAEFDVAGVHNFIGAGQGCVVSASTLHAFGGVGKCDILVLNSAPNHLADPLLSERVEQVGQQDIYFQLDKQLRQIIDLFVQEMRKDPNDKLLSRACNDTVLSLLQRHMQNYHALERETRLDMEVVDRYIDQHLGQKISVAQLASSVFLGESQFHSLFKEQTSQTPHQYVLNKRIQSAKTLIEQGHLTLGQIAELTGFSGQSAFTHAFSRQESISPSQYKKRFQPR